MADELCRKVAEQRCERYDTWAAQEGLPADRKFPTIFQKEDGFYYCRASMHESNSMENCEAIRMLNMFKAVLG